MSHTRPSLHRGARFVGLSTVASLLLASAALAQPSGLPGFEMSAWDAIFAPAGTPKPIIDKVNAAVRKALEDPQVKDSLLSRGTEVVPSTPEELAKHVASESARWGKVVKQTGAQID